MVNNYIQLWDSLYCIQGTLLVNMQGVYTVNKVAYRIKQQFCNFCTVVHETESTTSCQYMDNNTHQLL